MYKRQPLDDLVSEHAEAFSALFPEDFLRNIRIEGKLYGLPAYREQASNYGVGYNLSIAQECGIDMSQVTSYKDLTQIFESLSLIHIYILNAFDFRLSNGFNRP